MSIFTKYKKIEKPLVMERYSVDIVNKNNDIIDSELHKLELKNESQDNLLATKEALNTEISRAAAKENAIESSLNSEISRAETKENSLQTSLNQETKRASDEEKAIDQKINTETTRALAKEEELAEKIKDEANRAAAQEGIIDSKFSTEAATLRALIDTAYASANGYTDEKIAGLINGAPSTLDTLKEIADALESNETVVEALNDAIGTKANQNELDLHTSNAGIHVTATDKAGWNNPVFTQAETRENISSGESTPTLWGKVKKFFSDLKAVAFSGSYNDLSDAPAIGNATVTIKQDGITKGSFTTNQTGDITIELDKGVGSEDITPEGIGALALTGGEVTGETVFSSGTMASRQNGSSGTPGYVKIVQIKITSTYANHPLIFEIAGRGWSYSRKLYVFFASVNNRDPDLSDFLIDNSVQFKIAIVKSAASTWDIYMQKNENYGSCYICEVHKTFSGGYTVSYPNVQVSALPAGTTEPTVITWDKARDADTVDGKHASELQNYNNLSNRPTIPTSLPANGGTANYTNYVNANNIAANTDLNSITTPGFYYCPANATVATFANRPTNYAFFMVVGKHAGIYQEITEYMTANPKKYMRNYYGTWGNWYRVYTTADAPPDTNTTYGNMTGASTAAAGAAGLVPAPAKGLANRYLRSDGTWQVPPDTVPIHSTGWVSSVTVTAQTTSGALALLITNIDMFILSTSSSTVHVFTVYRGSGSATTFTENGYSAKFTAAGTYGSERIYSLIVIRGAWTWA